MATNQTFIPGGGRSGPVTVTGTVSAVQQRMELMNESSRSIWAFRVTGTDQNGSAIGPVQVEMRAISIEGSLADGDSVRVTGRWRRGVIRAEHVENLTMGTDVRAKNYTGLKIAVGALMLVFLGGVAYFGISSARESERRHEEIRRQQQQQREQFQNGLPEGYCETAEEAGLQPPQCD